MTASAAARARPAMTAAEVSGFLAREFPQVFEGVGRLTVEEADARHARVRLAVDDRRCCD